MKIIESNAKSFSKDITSGTVLVDFNASWCGPCRMLRPILEEIAKENLKAKIVSVDVDEAADLAIKYGISSIPCLVLFKNGQEISRSVGLRSKEEIEKILGE